MINDGEQELPFHNTQLSQIPPVVNEEVESPGTEVLEEQDVAETADFQRKILPWASIQFEEDVFRENILTARTRQQVIVVASLIDKIPNLAGLVRTGEIFNGTSDFFPFFNFVLKFL